MRNLRNAAPRTGALKERGGSCWTCDFAMFFREMPNPEKWQHLEQKQEHTFVDSFISRSRNPSSHAKMNAGAQGVS